VASRWLTRLAIRPIAPPEIAPRPSNDANPDDAIARTPDAGLADDVRAGVRHARDLASLPLSPASAAAAQARPRTTSAHPPKTYLDLIDWNDPPIPSASGHPKPHELAEQNGELD